MKARVHQLKSEMNTSKKDTRPIYVLCIRTIANSLLEIDDHISESNQVDAILQGLPEEYNPFIMMIYNKGDSIDIYDVEALLYVQEAQLDKYKQQLITLSATANIAHGQVMPNAARHC